MLVVQGSFGNTEEGRTGGWEGLWRGGLRRPGRGGDNSLAYASYLIPKSEGSLGFCLLLPCVIVLTALGTHPSSPPPHTLNSCTQPPSLAKVREVRGCQAERKPRGRGLGDALSSSLIIAWARAQQAYSVSWRMGPFSWAERASGKGGLLGSERPGLTLITFGMKGKLPNLSVLLCYKIKEGRERRGKDEVGEEGGQMDCRHGAG